MLHSQVKVFEERKCQLCTWQSVKRVATTMQNYAKHVDMGSESMDSLWKRASSS